MKQSSGESAAAAATAVAAAAGSSAGWASADSSKSPSLKDIMKQEEQQAKHAPESARPAPNSWAAKIGAGAAPPPQQQQRAAASAAAPATAQPSSAAAAAAAPRSQAAALASSTKTRELPVVRGMPPDMVEWCISSMNKIIGAEFNGTGLLEILVSLESPADIREIISETLGSVPLSSQFASEFIKRKQAAAEQLKKGKKGK